MSLIVRFILLLGGSFASLLVARDAENYPILQAMLGLLAATALLFAIALFRKR